MRFAAASFPRRLLISRPCGSKLWTQDRFIKIELSLQALTLSVVAGYAVDETSNHVPQADMRSLSHQHWQLKPIRHFGHALSPNVTYAGHESLVARPELLLCVATQAASTLYGESLKSNAGCTSSPFMLPRDVPTVCECLKTAFYNYLSLPLT